MHYFLKLMWFAGSYIFNSIQLVHYGSWETSGIKSFYPAHFDRLLHWMDFFSWRRHNSVDSHGWEHYCFCVYNRKPVFWHVLDYFCHACTRAAAFSRMFM